MAKNKKKITEDELLEKLSDLDIPDEDFAKYFLEDKNNGSALSPVVVPNQLLVESDGQEGAFFLNRFNDIARWRRNRKYKRRIKNWDGVRVVAEGDSWFQYPFILKDVIDQLNNLDHFQYAIYGLSEAGDLLKNIVREDEITEAVEREDPHILLVSGGGNDMLGNERIKELVHKYNASRKAENYPNDTFNDFLDELERLYHKLFDRLLRFKPHLKIFCHGYDYAIPADGEWLGTPLQEMKIVKKELQRQIIVEMINRFNQRLLDVVKSYPGAVFHVDCRSIVGPASQWYDELHPTNGGYLKVARQFDKVIQKVLTDSKSAPPIKLPTTNAKPLEKYETSMLRAETTVANIRQLNDAEFLNLVFTRAQRNNISGNLKLPSSEFERKQLEKDIEQHFEKVHLGADFLPSSFLEKGVERAQAVCRIVTDDTYASGFLIATRDFVMTNNHVLYSADKARRSKSQFDYDEDDILYEIEFDPDRFFMTDKDLDFTIVACRSESLPEEIQPIALLKDPETVTRGERVNIIQHPQGRTKEVSLHDNKVTYVYDKVVRYSADTEGGSSGSPVFNNQWDLVALHHAGWSEQNGGASNEGVRMTAIVDYLYESEPHESSSALETLLQSVAPEGESPKIPSEDRPGRGRIVKPTHKSSARNLTLNIEGNIDELTIRLR